jgi:hypothetical protein
MQHAPPKNLELPGPFGADIVEISIAFFRLLARSPKVTMLIRLMCVVERRLRIAVASAG